MKTDNIFRKKIKMKIKNEIKVRPILATKSTRRPD